MKKTNHTSLFLIELIFAIFIFCIIGAICLHLFASSHRINEESNLKLQCALKAQNVAEIWRTSEKADNYKLYYDKNWEECSKNHANFFLNATSQEDLLSIQIFQDNQVIYSLNVYKHTPIREE